MKTTHLHAPDFGQQLKECGVEKPVCEQLILPKPGTGVK